MRSPRSSAASAASRRGSSASSGAVAGARDRAAGGGAHQLGDELPRLLLRDRAGELGDQLALPDRLDRGDALDPQALRECGVGVDVDLGQHPGAAALRGEALQHRGELLARAAPLGPQVEHDRHLEGAVEHLGLEGLLGDVDDRGPRGTGRGGRAGRRCRLGPRRGLGAGLDGGEVDRAGEGGGQLGLLGLRARVGASGTGGLHDLDHPTAARTVSGVPGRPVSRPRSRRPPRRRRPAGPARGWRTACPARRRGRRRARSPARSARRSPPRRRRGRGR